MLQPKSSQDSTLNSQMVMTNHPRAQLSSNPIKITFTAVISVTTNLQGAKSNE